jgi:sugar phosphate isomerase/epimerase
VSPPPRFTLSAFGDEVADDLEAQLDLLASEGVRHLELRSAWGRNVLDLGPPELRRAADLLRDRGFRVSAVGSPIGKSDLFRPPAYELERLERALAAAAAVGTRLVRVFSFHVSPGEASARRAEVLERTAALAERAARAGALLVLENEKGVYGDTPERCLDLLEAVGSPALRFAFDPANFVQVGVPPLGRAWPLLAAHTAHVHVKDALLADGSVRPPGEGDADVPGLLAALAAAGFRGFLTLEPHLAHAGPSGGSSGEAGMRLALRALRGMLDGLPGLEVA